MAFRSPRKNLPPATSHINPLLAPTATGIHSPTENETPKAFISMRGHSKTITTLSLRVKMFQLLIVGNQAPPVFRIVKGNSKSMLMTLSLRMRMFQPLPIEKQISGAYRMDNAHSETILSETILVIPPLRMKTVHPLMVGS